MIYEAKAKPARTAGWMDECGGWFYIISMSPISFVRSLAHSNSMSMNRSAHLFFRSQVVSASLFRFGSIEERKGERESCLKKKKKE